jgi:hypothetical protein
MGIQIQLRRENGEVLAEVHDPKMILSRAAVSAFSGTRLLRYLMPWGDTVFNQAQAADLQSDVKEVLQTHNDKPLGDMLRAFSPLIDRLSAELHVYLWFMGD